jgi:hypothetical protein
MCGRAGGFGVLPVAEEGAESISGPLHIAAVNAAAKVKAEFTEVEKKTREAEKAAAKASPKVKARATTKSASATWLSSGALSGGALKEAKEKARLIAAAKKSETEKKMLLKREQNQESTRGSVATGASTGLSINVDTDASNATPPRPGTVSIFARSALLVESSSDDDERALKKNTWAKAVHRGDASDDETDGDVSLGLIAPLAATASVGRSERRKSSMSGASPASILHTSPLQIARARAAESAVDEADETVAVVGLALESPSEQNALMLRSPPPPSRPASAAQQGDFKFDDEDDGDAIKDKLASTAPGPRPPTAGAAPLSPNVSPTAALEADLSYILSSVLAPETGAAPTAPTAPHILPFDLAASPLAAKSPEALEIVADSAHSEAYAHDFDSWASEPSVAGAPHAASAPAEINAGSTDDWENLLAEAESILQSGGPAFPSGAFDGGASPVAATAAPFSAAPPSIGGNNVVDLFADNGGRTKSEAEATGLSHLGVSASSAEERLEQALAAVEAAALAASNSPTIREAQLESPSREAQEASLITSPPLAAWAETPPMQQKFAPVGRPVTAPRESSALRASTPLREISPLSKVAMLSLSPISGGGPPPEQALESLAATSESARLVAPSFILPTSDVPPPPPTALPAPSTRRNARPLFSLGLGSPSEAATDAASQQRSPIQLGALRLGPRYGGLPPQENARETPPRLSAVSAVSALAPDGGDLEAADKPPGQAAHPNGWFE